VLLHIFIYICVFGCDAESNVHVNACFIYNCSSVKLRARIMSCLVWAPGRAHGGRDAEERKRVRERYENSGTIRYVRYVRVGTAPTTTTTTACAPATARSSSSRHIRRSDSRRAMIVCVVGGRRGQWRTIIVAIHSGQSCNERVTMSSSCRRLFRPIDTRY